MHKRETELYFPIETTASCKQTLLEPPNEKTRLPFPGSSVPQFLPQIFQWTKRKNQICHQATSQERSKATNSRRREASYRLARNLAETKMDFEKGPEVFKKRASSLAQWLFLKTILCKQRVHPFVIRIFFLYTYKNVETVLSQIIQNFKKKVLKTFFIVIISCFSFYF